MSNPIRVEIPTPEPAPQPPTPDPVGVVAGRAELLAEQAKQETAEVASRQDSDAGRLSALESEVSSLRSLLQKQESSPAETSAPVEAEEIEEVEEVEEVIEVPPEPVVEEKKEEPPKKAQSKLHAFLFGKN